MSKKVIIVGTIGAIVLGGVIFLSVKNSKKAQNAPSTPSFSQEENNQKEGDDGIILFYGNGCPHCANVDKFVEENGVKEKVDFRKLEIFGNKENSKLMAEKFKACGLSTESMGVPFLWDGEKCYSGDADVIEFFKQKIGQ